MQREQTSLGRCLLKSVSVVVFLPSRGWPVKSWFYQKGVRVFLGFGVRAWEFLLASSPKTDGIYFFIRVYDS